MEKRLRKEKNILEKKQSAASNTSSFIFQKGSDSIAFAGVQRNSYINHNQSLLIRVYRKP